ncbi:MAG: 4-hydroxy-tetrahydrodipicolinate reductase [Bacteroidales bacterium]|nr:4-hydroxy-tetrahydrodipicolinate reductase [Bacteroidales bacterium]
MKIAIIGYGKMGHAVEAMALKRGHTIGAIIDNKAQWVTHLLALQDCDVAVEFSTPKAAKDNILQCLDYRLPVVTGTTGWYQVPGDIEELCALHGGTLFWASNYSVGMNIMFELNRRLAELMDAHPGYAAGIVETHHIHKVDAPSGTAISLANDIVARLKRKERWQLVDAHDRSLLQPEVLPVVSYREGEVPGIHEVSYDSFVDTLSIRHEAKGREGLALGALLAAEFLPGKTGFYTMRDMLGGTHSDDTKA